MKQIKRTGRILAGVSLVMALGFTACSKDDDMSAGTTYSISGSANGSQVVPSVAGNGTGNITGTYNTATGTMNYTSSWNGLTGAPTSGGFYSGASGSAGTSVGSPWTMGSGLSATGTYSGTMNLNADQASQLTSGNMYYSMGTATNTGGEIRGQMTATQQ